MRMTTISFFTVNFRTHFLFRGDLSIVSFFQEIDVIAADLTQTWSRMAIVDFSKPFLATSLTLLLKVIDRVPVQCQKSYLDLGFCYSICPTQPIFTNTETAMLLKVISTRNWFFKFPSFHYTLDVKKFFFFLNFFFFTFLLFFCYFFGWTKMNAKANEKEQVLNFQQKTRVK